MSGRCSQSQGLTIRVLTPMPMVAIALSTLLIVSARPSNVCAQEYLGGKLRAVAHFAIGAPVPSGIGMPTPSSSGPVHYSNLDNPTGGAFSQGPAATVSGNGITRMVADDITGVHPGADVVEITFSVANQNPVSVTCRARLRFWSANGAGGVPGTYLGSIGLTFPAFAFPPGVTIAAGGLPAGLFPMPGSKFWAGIVFDNENGMTGATLAQLGNMGQALFSPPTLGSSNDVLFETTAAGSFLGVNNPAGARVSQAGGPKVSTGWQFTDGSSVPPILFVHGICSDESMWGDFKQRLIDLGYPSGNLHTLSMSPSGSRPQDLEPQLDEAIRLIPGSGPIAVVAHSMGGLVTREYIARLADNAANPYASVVNRVKTLITLGTPHHGCDATAWLEQHQGIKSLLARHGMSCQLEAPQFPDLLPGSRFLNGLNYGAGGPWDVPASQGGRSWDSHAQESLRDPSVQYYTVGGTFPLCLTGGSLTAPAWLSRLDPTHVAFHLNDGVVAATSARLYGVSNQVHNWTDGGLGIEMLTHSDLTWFCGTSFSRSPSLPDIVTSILRGTPPPGGTITQELPKPAGPSVQDVQGDSLTDLPSIEGTLAAGQVAERQFALPQTTLMRALVAGTSLHLRLRSPQGVVLSAADTATVAGLTFVSDGSQGIEGFSLTNPAPGTWALILDGSPSPQAQGYIGVVEYNSGRRIAIRLSESWVYPGSSIALRAQVDSGLVRLPIVAWNALVMAPDSTTTQLVLYDDGAHGDSLANDRTFGNALAPSGPAGFYGLTAVALLSDGISLIAGGSVELVPRNDLAVLSSEVGLSRNVVSAGDSVLVNAIVHNYCDSAVPGATVEVWDDSTGVLIDSVRVNLPAHGSIGITVPWIVGAEAKHLVRVTVSPFTLTFETSYGNNSGFRSVNLGQPVGVGSGGDARQLQLAPAVPNPSIGSTMLRFSLSRKGPASLVIYDVLGRQVRKWQWTDLEVGEHQISWDGRSDEGRVIAPGVLLYRLTAAGQTLRQKLIHMQ